MEHDGESDMPGRFCATESVITLARGRPVSQVTKLGRLITARDEDAYKVAAACGFANRTLTEYLAGRRYIRANHAHALAEYFQVEVSDIVDEDITEDQTDVTGRPLNGAYSVRELPQRPMHYPRPLAEPKPITVPTKQATTVPIPQPRRK